MYRLIPTRAARDRCAALPLVCHTHSSIWFDSHLWCGHPRTRWPAWVKISESGYKLAPRPTAKL